MPKKVDHAERRRHVADALFRVIVRDGIDAVSLRHVAAEAGVTTGMVQHHFASKDEMMAFALETASARYEERIRDAVAALGPTSSAGAALRTVLTNFIPEGEAELRDAHITLAFLAYAAGRRDARSALAAGDDRLRAWLATLISEAAGLDDDAASVRSTGLLATAEGLAQQVLTAGLAPADAMSALDAQLRLNGIA